MFGRTARPPILREDALHEAPFGTLLLRPLKRSDRNDWHLVRRANFEWLKPWEATVPIVPGEPRLGGTYTDYVRALNDAARAGESYMWGIFLDSAFVGQISLGSISMGSARNAQVGYWVSQSVAGRGVAPTTVAMVIDYAFEALKLHRIEVNIRPSNHASLRVAEKLGLRYEGLRERFLHIDGEWADHSSFAITSEELTGSMLQRWRASEDS